MATSTIKSNADFVVEQGTSGTWAYRKWNSGIAECWKRLSKNADSSGNATIAESLPSFLITSAPTISVWAGQSGNSSGTTSAVYVNGSSGAYKANATFKGGWGGSGTVFNIIAFGVWK